MKLLRFLEGIVQVIRAVSIVIIDKEARIKAIHTWTNKVSLVGYREGNAHVVTKDLDALWITKNKDEYELTAILYSSEKGRRSYPMRRSGDRSELVRHRELLEEEISNSKVLP